MLSDTKTKDSAVPLNILAHFVATYS